VIDIDSRDFFFFSLLVPQLLFFFTQLYTLYLFLASCDQQARWNVYYFFSLHFPWELVFNRSASVGMHCTRTGRRLIKLIMCNIPQQSVRIYAHAINMASRILLMDRSEVRSKVGWKDPNARLQ
jgi:hypothetical protein